MTADPLTFPHDYRRLFLGDVKPVVVGGQAVSLWAITYLEEGDVGSLAKYGSGDMDVLRDDAVLSMLRSLPGWRFEKTALWQNDIRAARAFGKSEDGRTLLVEVLTKVNGLDAADLGAVSELSFRGIEYRVLDPIAMLKAKVANLRSLKQDGREPRHDGEHLRIIARCVPRYLLNLVARVGSGLSEREVLIHIGRTVDLLTDKRIVAVMLREGIDPRVLLPAGLGVCGSERIQRAFEHQMPRVRMCADELDPPAPDLPSSGVVKSDGPVP